MNGAVRWLGQGRHSKSESSQSDCLHQTQSTDSTEYSYIGNPGRPWLPRSDTCQPRMESAATTAPVACGSEGAYEWDSLDSRVSTIASEDEDNAGRSTTSSSGLTDSEFDVEILDDDSFTDAVPASPREFGETFPSRHRISIRHDDSTMDGNMNLRLDTQVETKGGYRRQLTLFYLRMHDLRSRDFSLRRYCRDSGREVCHSTRKYHQSGLQRRPGLPHSFTNAFANFLRQADSHPRPSSSYLKRSDSGYAPSFGNDATADRPGPATKKQQPLMDVIKVEFSNYAQVEMRRKGSGSRKRYTFEYWGFRFAWKRYVFHDGGDTRVAFHLMRDEKPGTLARIVPVSLTPGQAEDEEAKGGWVAPCSMWITDGEINSMADVADVVVATGVLSLVDDSIRRRWHSKTSRRLLLPVAATLPFNMNLEYVGPKRLIDEVFHRSRPGSRGSSIVSGNQRLSARRTATA